MIDLLSKIKILVPENIYIKNPKSSELEMRIVEHSILLIESIGIYNSTFRKLGVKIGSNENSIYRFLKVSCCCI